jgi:hypothetical protein
MCSSVEPFGWDALEFREQPQVGAVFSPAAAVESLLGRYRRDLEAAQAALTAVQDAGVQALAEQAIFVVQLASVIEAYTAQIEKADLGKIGRHFRILKDQMLDALKQAGLEVEVPLGKPYSALGNDAQIDGWRHKAEYEAEVVAEVVEPIVRQGGRLVRAGRVIMGAPLSASPEGGATDLKKTELGG